VIIDSSYDAKAIQSRFGRSIRTAHAFAIDAFQADGLLGDTPEAKLATLLATVVEILPRLRSRKNGSFSIWVENGVLRWAPYGAQCLCLYIGGVDRFYLGSLEKALREELCAHPAYLASESGVPAEDALFLGYYSPRARAFYLAREMLPAVALVVRETAPEHRRTVRT
jgi:hypothetical protein